MTHPYTVQPNRTGARIQVSDPQGRAYLLTPDQARSMAAELTMLAGTVTPGRPARRHYGASSWECVTPGQLWRCTSHPGYALTFSGGWLLQDPHGHRIDLQVRSLGAALRHTLRFLPEPLDGDSVD